MKSILTVVFIVVFSALSVAQSDTSNTDDFVPEPTEADAPKAISDFRPVVSL